MPHRVSKGGSYRIDREIPGVGRLAIASGATTRKGLKRRKNLIDRLIEDGRLDILRMIQRREVPITEVLDAAQRKDLDMIAGGKPLTKPLWDTVEAWTPKPRPGRRAQSPQTIRRYKTSFTQLRNTPALKKTATVGDLARVDWVHLDQQWGRSPADWNHLRAAVSKFLSDQVGMHDPVRRQMMESFPKRPEVERVPDISVELFWKIVNHTPEHVRASYVVLAHLGLDTGEYLELTKDHLKPHTFSIEAPGTKTDARYGTLRVDPRMWEWIERGIPSKVQYGWLRKHWKRGLAAAEADTTLRLQDLRHCPAQWATDKGVPGVKIQAFMRHTNQRMTDRYRRQKDRGEVATAVADAMLRSA